MTYRSGIVRKNSYLTQGEPALDCFDASPAERYGTEVEADGDGGEREQEAYRNKEVGGEKEAEEE